MWLSFILISSCHTYLLVWLEHFQILWIALFPSRKKKKPSQNLVAIYFLFPCLGFYFIILCILEHSSWFLIFSLEIFTFDLTTVIAEYSRNDKGYNLRYVGKEWEESMVLCNSPWRCQISFWLLDIILKN